MNLSVQEQIDVYCSLLSSENDEVVDNALAELIQLYKRYHSLQVLSSLERTGKLLSREQARQKISRALGELGR